MAEISVVIPVYNTAPFLERCLDSLAAQSFKDWEAICVDASPACAALIRRNGEKLGLTEGLQVLNADYGAILSSLVAQGKRIDIVFLDPPYASGYAADAVRRIFQEGILSPSGTVIVEHASDQPPELGEGPWQVSRVKRYGTCSVTTLIWRERE